MWTLMAAIGPWTEAEEGRKGKVHSHRDAMIFADAGKKAIRTSMPPAGAGGWLIFPPGTLNLLQTALSRLVQGDIPALPSLGADRAHREMQFDRRGEGRRMSESAAFFFAAGRRGRFGIRFPVFFPSVPRPLLR